MVGSYQKYPEGLRGCSLTLQCLQVGDSVVSVSTQAEVVKDNGRKLPKVPPKNGKSSLQSFKRLGARRLTKAEEADNSTRKLATLPQRLARAHHISRSTLKIF